MDMFRVTANWQGFPGAPGYSNFYFSSGLIDGGLFGDEAQLLANRVRNAFNEIVTMLPNNVSISIDPEVPMIDSDTGMAQSYNTIEPPEPVVATGDRAYAGPAGAVITWRTGDLRNGRRIRGRTFLVPMSSFVFDTDGTLSSSRFEFLREFADTLIGGPGTADLGVWSRPVNGSGGVFATVTGYTIPDLAAVLRSRRD